MLVVELLLPSWWEVQVSVVVAALVVMAYCFFLIGESCGCGDGRRFGDSSPGGASVNDEKQEIVEHSYSCALERSFLYHGRMCISAGHICFHSNVFSKKMKVIIPLGDIDEVKRSQHALINPAITIIIRVASGVPPFGNSDGRVRYKFASFWNRNQALLALQHAVKNYHAILDADKKEQSSPIDSIKGKVRPSLLDIKKERQQPALHEFGKEKEQLAMHSDSSPADGNESQFKIPEQVVAKPKKSQPFIKEEDVLPCTVEQFFKLIFDDSSTFLKEFHTAFKDINLTVGQWRNSDEFNGQVRKVTFRRFSKHAMCDPEMQMTESQHIVLSADKKTLVLESVLVTEGCPFALYFECHYKWSVEAKSESSCTVDIGFGLYFKKWFLLQSKMKAVAQENNKKEWKMKLDAARSYITSRISNSEIDSVASPITIKKSK